MRDIPDDLDDIAITAAIIDLARNLQITSIAEGVERPAQLALLKSRGCEEVQGFLISPALTAEEMGARLANARTAATASATQSA